MRGGSLEYDLSHHLNIQIDLAIREYRGALVIGTSRVQSKLAARQLLRPCDYNIA